MGIIKQMREAAQPEVKKVGVIKVWQTDHWFGAYIVRHFSIYVTWLFVKIGISANFATFLMTLSGLIGVSLCVPHILWLNILGVGMLIFAYVLDCVDGEIARWTEKSSVKGLYLELVNHVLCNAPPFMLCGLHLYVLNGQVKHMILAFLAYATAQWRFVLRGVYYRVNVESFSDEQSKPRGSAPSGFTLQKWPYGMRILFNLAKWLLLKLTDITVNQFISFVCIFLSYAATVWPMVFFAWFFVIFGILGVIGEIANKFVFHVPHTKHIRKM